MKALAWRAGAFLIAGLALVACESKQAPLSTTPVVRMADPRFMGLLPFYVADRNGYFAREGVEISWLDVREPAQIEKLYSTDQVDVIMTTYPALLPREAQVEKRSRILLAAFEDLGSGGSALLVPGGSSAASISDLFGKRIGTYAGASQRVYAELVLAKAAFPSGTEVVQVSTTAQVAGLMSGAYDALFTVEPYVSIAKSAGARVLESDPRARFLGNPFAVGAAVASPRLSQDTRSRLERGLESALVSIASQNQDSRVLLAKRLGLEPRLANEMALYRWVVRCDPRDVESIQGSVRMLQSAGLVPEGISAQDFFERTEK